MIDLLMHTDRRYATAMSIARRARNQALRSLVRALVRLPLRAGRALALRWRRRRLVAELRALNDLVLADIGLYRGDIRSTVDAMLRRERSGSHIAGHMAGERPVIPEAYRQRGQVQSAPLPDPAHNDNATGAASGPASPPWTKKAS